MHPIILIWNQWGKSLVCLGCLTLLAWPVLAQNTTQDSLIFIEKKKIATNLNHLPGNTLTIAKSFLGRPYINGTLESVGDERLVVNLRDFDCWTLVENSLAIALTLRDGGDFNSFQWYLQQLRYWGGSIQGYGSRIHYFSGWIIQAEKTGYLKDVTQDMGGIPYQKSINYISLRPNKFPKIKKAETLKAILRAETRITNHPRYYIPKARIKSLEHLIQEGDIIMLSSVKAGLDISHEGFAVLQNGRIHLLHASSLNKKVIISRQPLAEYVMSQRGQNGIIIARLAQ
jgi:hypothetical protein